MRPAREKGAPASGLAGLDSFSRPGRDAEFVSSLVEEAGRALSHCTHRRDLGQLMYVHCRHVQRFTLSGFSSKRLAGRGERHDVVGWEDDIARSSMR